MQRAAARLVQYSLSPLARVASSAAAAVNMPTPTSYSPPSTTHFKNTLIRHKKLTIMLCKYVSSCSAYLPARPIFRFTGTGYCAAA